MVVLTACDAQVLSHCCLMGKQVFHSFVSDQVVLSIMHSEMKGCTQGFRLLIRSDHSGFDHCAVRQRAMYGQAVSAGHAAGPQKA